MTRFALPCALALATAGIPAHAGTVAIWPVDPVITPGGQATSLWLENNGKEPVTLQVRSFGWSQSGAADALAEQDEVVASPPIATVAPGHRQLVRVIRRSASVGGVPPERSYRLLIDELPTAPASGPDAQVSARLAVQMRYSIPLFAYAADPARQTPRLVATYRVGPAGREVEIRNSGTGHARLTDMRLLFRGVEQMLKPGLAGYVLPGAAIRYPLPTGAPGTIRVGVNGRDETLAPDA